MCIERCQRVPVFSNLARCLTIEESLYPNKPLTLRTFGGLQVRIVMLLNLGHHFPFGTRPVPLQCRQVRSKYSGP